MNPYAKQSLQNHTQTGHRQILLQQFIKAYNSNSRLRTANPS